MGFSKFYLIGMDYLYSNPKNGHFYEYGINKQGADVKGTYLKRVNKVIKFFSHQFKKKIYIISSTKFKSELIKNISYEKQFNSRLKYKENFDIIKMKNLKDLSNVPFKYKIFNN